MIRAYHGDHIPERRFKRWFLPVELPSYATPSASGSSKPRPGGMFDGVARKGRQEGDAQKLPIASLFVREVERRLDTVVFRSCFATSAREARSLVVQGKVKVNGVKVSCLLLPRCLPSSTRLPSFAGQRPKPLDGAR